MKFKTHIVKCVTTDVSSERITQTSRGESRVRRYSLVYSLPLDGQRVRGSRDLLWAESKALKHIALTTQTSQ